MHLTYCSAVDNVLAKLAEAGVPLLRLGRPATVHPALQGHLPGGVHFPDTSVAGLAAIAAGARVVSIPKVLLATCSPHLGSYILAPAF